MTIPTHEIESIVGTAVTSGWMSHEQGLTLEQAIADAIRAVRMGHHIAHHLINQIEREEEDPNAN